jgi:PEGA domain
MKPAALGGALVWICCLALAPVLAASGSHGAGHSGGSHSSGGHAATGGGATGGHRGGQTGGPAPRGTAAPRSPDTTQTTSAPAGHVHGGQPIVGTAVPRTSAKPTPLVAFPFSYPFYRGWPYYGTALGLGGLGFYVDPLWSSYRYPGAAYMPGTLEPDASAAAFAEYPFDLDGPTGGLRLRVEPKHARVYVDGYYAGIVDDFNGHFQHLDLRPGPHHVEISGVPGYEPLAFEVAIQAHHTTEYRGALSRTVQ